MKISECTYENVNFLSKKRNNKLSNIFFIIGSFLLFSPLTFAQSNKEKDKPADSLTIQYLLNSNLNLTIGNENDFNTFSEGMLKINRHIIGARVRLNYYYEKEEKEISANEFRADVRVNIFPQKKLFGFVNGGYEHSLLRLHNLRLYTGLGAVYKLIDEENNRLFPSLKVLYEFTDYMSPLLIDLDTISKRASLRGEFSWLGSHKILKERLVIHYNFAYNQSLQILKDYRVRGTVSISLPVYKMLSFEIGATLNYENVVPLHTQTTDVLVYFGLTITNF